METRRTKILGFALLLAGLALCGTGLWLLLSPAQYQATARIKINPDMPPINGNGHIQPVYDVYDPYFIQTEFEVIQSEIVLSNVISTLNLNEKLAERYNAGNPFKIDETIRFLIQRMSINLVRNTKLVEIHFISEDPDEAARIANAIAKAYGDYRLKLLQTDTINGIQVLEKKYLEDEEQIRVLQTNVDLLREKYKINKDDETDFDNGGTTLSNSKFLTPSQQEEFQKEYETNKPFWDAKRKLNEMIEFHKFLFAKIAAEKLDLQLRKTSMVEIVDVAQPPKFPAGPNRWLGAVLLAAGLLPTLGGLLLLKSSFRRAD